MHNIVQLQSSACRAASGQWPVTGDQWPRTCVLQRPAFISLSAAISCGRSTGWARSSLCACEGLLAVMSPSGPMKQRSEVTTASRKGSMAGLVTWAEGGWCGGQVVWWCGGQSRA